MPFLGSHQDRYIDSIPFLSGNTLKINPRIRYPTIISNKETE